MPRYSYDRLTALDHSFLFLERPHTPMHVGTVAIHELGALRGREGGVDIDLVRRGIARRAAPHPALPAAARLDRRSRAHPVGSTTSTSTSTTTCATPACRARAAPSSSSGSPARIMAQRLDRSRPLWEMWVVEGLEDDRFAMLTKIHHCMIDGVSGVDLMNVLMSPSADAEIFEPVPFVPRPAPAAFELLRDELLRRARLPFEAVRDTRKLHARGRETPRREISVRLRAVREMLGGAFQRSSPTAAERARRARTAASTGS